MTEVIDMPAATRTARPGLGDVGPHDDASYTGDYSPDNPLTLDYYREKAREFQDTLNALDKGYSVLVALATNPDLVIPEEARQEIEGLMGEFETRKTVMRVTAEAINAGAALINAAGGRMPQLSVPGTLGLLPVAIPVATIAAFGTAAAIISWGIVWLAGTNDLRRFEQILDAQSTPEQKAEVARLRSVSEQAISEANGNVWGSISGLVKWGAIVALGYLGWRALESFQGRRGRR